MKEHWKGSATVQAQILPDTPLGGISGSLSFPQLLIPHPKESEFCLKPLHGAGQKPDTEYLCGTDGQACEQQRQEKSEKEHKKENRYLTKRKAQGRESTLIT